MPSISLAQATSFTPGVNDGWWNVLTRPGTWSTVSFAPSSWVISLQGGQTLTYGSASGFTAPAFPSDPAQGIIDSLVLKDAAGSVVISLTGLAGLGLTPASASANPSALVSGHDVVSGSAGADTIVVLGDADVVSAGNGGDSVFGGEGNDTLDGGSGNDTIDDFTGFNEVTGGAGADRLRVYGGRADGGDGDDWMDLSGATGLGGDGNDTIAASAVGGAVVIDAGAGDDSVTAYYTERVATVQGGAGNDTLDADYRGGVLVDGRIGDITYEGFEHIVVSIRGAASADASALSGGIGMNLHTIDARATGTAGADTIVGSGGGNTIAGGLGDDVLDGGITHWGTFVSQMPGGGTYTVAPRYDVADYSAASAAVVVDLNVVLQSTNLGADRLTNFESVIGSAYNDTLVGSVGEAADGLVAGYSGSRLYGGAGDDRLVGSSVADTLVGGAGIDRLEGGAGDDALDSSAGADLVFGGAGKDKFLLGVTGGVDTLADFSVAEGDSLLVLDASGAMADGRQGLLIWNQGTGAISWDADSDAGALAPVTLATAVGAIGQLSRANLASGFQPSATRVIAADGSMVETVFDWGVSGLDRGVASYDTAGRIVEHDVYRHNGSYSNRWFDPADTVEWGMRYAEYDTQNQLLVYAVELDDGSRTTYTFDPAGLKPYSREVYEFAPGDALKYYGLAWDDGSRSERFFDYDNSKPYTHIIEDYDAIGRLIGRATYGDDGSVFLG